MAVDKVQVLAIMDSAKAQVEALPDIDMGAEVMALQAQVADLQGRVSALEAKVSQAISVLQA